MCTVIISIGAERFGIKHPKAKNTTKPKQRGIKITLLRKGLESLKL